MKPDATVAQSVEQLIRNQQAAGSSPASSSKIPNAHAFGIFISPYLNNSPVPTGMSVIKKSPLPFDKGDFMERVTRLELATSTLARWRSTG